MECAAIWLVGNYTPTPGEVDRRGEKCRREATHAHAGHPCCWVHFMAANGPRAGTAADVRFVEPLVAL